MTLYQKYRPKKFDDVVAQSFIIKTLQGAILSQKPHHSYLFFGSRGTGKTTTARILAKALNCLNVDKNGNPCNECENCMAANKDSFVDLIEIDGASNRKIEYARSIIEKISFQPTIGKRKIYIIDEVHMLTKEAFNALLKTIEEPPEHAFFILATTELEKVPETIKSRCQTFIFRKFKDEDIFNRLKYITEKENFICDDKVLNIIAKKSNGGMRDALVILDQIISFGNGSIESVQEELGILSEDYFENLYQNIKDKNTEKCIEIVNEALEKSVNISDFLDDFISFLRDAMMNNLGNDDELFYIIDIIDIFNQANLDLKSFELSRLPVEIAIIKATKNKPTNINNEVSENIKKIEETENIEKKEDENLNSIFEKILKSVKDPILKATLKQIKSKVIEGNKIKLEVSSEIWKKQIESVEKMITLKKELKLLTNKDFEIEILVKKEEKISMDDINKVFT